MTRSTSHPPEKSVLRGRPTDRHVRVGDDGRPVEILGVRQRFGGIDLGASIAGALAALGVTVLLGAIAGSIGTVGYQLDAERGTDTLSAGGLVAGLVILVAAFLIGGWVAGRMARYDGAKNGVLAAVWFIVVAALLAGAGAWLGDKYDAFADLPVPQWFSSNATTTAAIVSGVIAAIVMLGAGLLGGLAGARYHARADEYLAAEERDQLTHEEPVELLGDDTRERPHEGDRSSQRARDVDLRPGALHEDQPDEIILLEGVDRGTVSSRDERTTRMRDAEPGSTAR